jgi:hypothetical protein
MEAGGLEHGLLAGAVQTQQRFGQVDHFFLSLFELCVSLDVLIVFGVSIAIAAVSDAI